MWCCSHAVPTILDLTVGFLPDSAEPTLLNIIQGRRCSAEMYIRYKNFALFHIFLSSGNWSSAMLKNFVGCSYEGNKRPIVIVCHSRNSIVHINKVKLHRARLVLGLVTTYGGYTVPVIIYATQPGHPFVGGRSKYRWPFWPSLGKKPQVLRSSEHCYQDCWHTGLL